MIDYNISNNCNINFLFKNLLLGGMEYKIQETEYEKILMENEDLKNKLILKQNLIDEY